MRLRLVLLSLTAGASVVGVALAQQPAAPPQQVPGYLSGPSLPDVSRILPPPPAEGGARQNQDLDIYRATRALQDTPRWNLAKNDVSYAIGDLLRDYSCSAGVELSAANAPKTAMLLRRVLRDTGSASGGAKQVFQRKRPYLFVDGPICVDKSADLAASPDYPSGHSTLGWASALVLAELAPDRSTQIMNRGRAYGESRVVCGVHTVSAIEAGRSTAAAVVAAQHGSAEFRADMDAARAEIAALRSSGKAPDAAACAVETELTSRSPY